MNSVSETSAGVSFGRFRVLPHRRELLVDGRPVRLGGRAFDVLIALIEVRGAVISKNSLMELVWPDRIVEENNLQAQIVALRKALAADRDLIRTVYGRGYQFTGEIVVLPGIVDKRAGTGIVATKPGSAVPPTNLPEPVSELIGRDEEASEILNLVAAHRLVTLVGAGGIGKTKLAVILARELLPHFADGVWLTELSSLTDPGLVPATVAAAVGLELGGGIASAERVAHALAGRPLLLVLDTCEHVIGVAAAFSEAVLRAGSAAQIIATSREPLTAEGEWTYPVPPLAVPTVDVGAEDNPLQYGAVRLFIERARAVQHNLAPGHQAFQTIASICRRLDGIPLAIEMAAARVATLGIDEIAARLDDRFRLLTGARRTALRRHQTLQATLDWSYELLTERERMVLRRLAVFAGCFSLQAASLIGASDGLASSEVIDRLSSLVAKSLVVLEVDSAILRYRLLDTTRAYALAKLEESGESRQVARLHAEFFRDQFVTAAFGRSRQPSAAEMRRNVGDIDNVRAAIDWSFSESGEPAIGVALTAAFAPVWLSLSLMSEFQDRAEHVLRMREVNADPRTRMELQIALGTSLTVTLGLVERIRGALTDALQLADDLDDLDTQARALWALWALHYNTGEFPAAEALAKRFSYAASRTNDTGIILISDRVMGYTLQNQGEHRQARLCFERVLQTYVGSQIQRDKTWFLYDQRALTRAMLARCLWLQGFLDQARVEAQASLAEAESANDQLATCFALAQAVCPIALMRGDILSAECALKTLTEISTRQSFARYETVARSLDARLLIERGEFESGTALLRATLDERDKWMGRFTEYFCLLARGMAGLGQLAKALATVDQELARIEAGAAERWYLPELLRIKGEVMLQIEDGRSTSAEESFAAAMTVAHQQGALFWELRAATSMAQLRARQHRAAEARSALLPVYRRFTEGFDTVNLKSARAVLDDIG